MINQENVPTLEIQNSVAFNNLIDKQKKETKIKELTDPKIHSHVAIVVKKANGEFIVRKAYPPSHAPLLNIASKVTMDAGRHPVHNMPLATSTHLDKSFSIEEEYSDGGDLSYYIDKIRAKLQTFSYMPPEERVINNEYIEFRTHQIQFAKSIAKQLIDYIFWLETVIKKGAHKNITPKTILLRREGYVKMKMFGYITEDIVKLNPHHFMIDSVYTAPEFCESVNARMNADFSNDIWAVGAIIYSIMTGENIYPAYRKINPYDPKQTQTHNNDKISDTKQKTKFDSFMAIVKKTQCLEDSVTEEHLKPWYDLCIDPSLAHLARKCLTINHDSRPRSNVLLSYIYLSSPGLVQNNYDQSNTSLNDRYNLHNIITPPRAYIRTDNDTKWHMVLPWSKVNESWCMDLA
jgi:serine/threonine protein kinase